MPKRSERILLYRGEEFNSNFYYFSGLDLDHSFYLSNPKTLFVPRLNYTLAKKLFKGKVISYADQAVELKKGLSEKKLCADFRSLPASVYRKISRFCRLSDASEWFLKTRSKKSAGEVSLIKKASAITKKLFDELDFSKLKTENQVSSFLFSRTYDLGCEPAFTPIVASGANSRFPHYQSGKNAKLKSLVLVDYGVKYKNYRSDFTRVFFLDRNKEAEKNYETLKSIFHVIADAYPQFRTGKDLAKFAEKQYAKHRFPLPPHSWGHGIGLDVHEFPRLSKKYSDSLFGATVAIEPSVYFSKYGLRFENTCYFDGKKLRVF